jgi:hypothetical protein
MTGLAFKKAVRSNVMLRLALMGPPGAGKTFSALAIATRLGAGRVALVDTERGSALKYADRFGFDHLELERHSPDDYIAALEAARQGGYKALVIDSWSHAWSGRGGALEMVDESARRSKSGNTFNAWRDVTPAHNRMVDALLSFPGHLIVTLRSKVEYVVENDGKKSVPRKVGMAPIQRDGVEYEFDIVGEMNLDNELVVGKTRCFELRERIFKHPGENVAAVFRPWLSGAPESAEAVGKVNAQLDELRAFCKAGGVDEATFKRLAKAVKLGQMPLAEALKEAGESAQAPESPTPPARERPEGDKGDPWGIAPAADDVGGEAPDAVRASYFRRVADAQKPSDLDPIGQEIQDDPRLDEPTKASLLASLVAKADVVGPLKPADRPKPKRWRDDGDAGARG